MANELSNHKYGIFLDLNENNHNILGHLTHAPYLNCTNMNVCTVKRCKLVRQYDVVCDMVVCIRLHNKNNDKWTQID